MGFYRNNTSKVVTHLRTNWKRCKIRSNKFKLNVKLHRYVTQSLGRNVPIHCSVLASRIFLQIEICRFSLSASFSDSMQHSAFWKRRKFSPSFTSKLGNLPVTMVTHRAFITNLSKLFVKFKFFFFYFLLALHTLLYSSKFLYC